MSARASRLHSDDGDQFVTTLAEAEDGAKLPIDVRRKRAGVKIARAADPKLVAFWSEVREAAQRLAGRAKMGDLLEVTSFNERQQTYRFDAGRVAVYLTHAAINNVRTPLVELGEDTVLVDGACPWTT